MMLPQLKSCGTAPELLEQTRHVTQLPEMLIAKDPPQRTEATRV